MVTTNRLIPVEAIGNATPELVHLTGSFHALGRVTVGCPDDLPTRVQLCFDAGRVRGVGLKSGVKYEARGAYRFVDDPPELPALLDRVGAFELLRHASGEAPPARLLLVVLFRVTVERDGRMMADLGEPTLLPCPGG